MTRKDKLLEVFPSTLMSPIDDAPICCVRLLGYKEDDCSKSNKECSVCWNKEYEVDN